MSLAYPQTIKDLTHLSRDPLWIKRGNTQKLVDLFIKQSNQCEHYIVSPELLREIKSTFFKMKNEEIIEWMRSASKEDIPLPFDYCSFQPDFSTDDHNGNVYFSAVGREAFARMMEGMPLDARPLSRAYAHLVELHERGCSAFLVSIGVIRTGPNKVGICGKWVVTKSDSMTQQSDMLHTTTCVVDAPVIDRPLTDFETAARLYDDPYDTFDLMLRTILSGKLYGELCMLLSVMHRKNYIQGLESVRVREKVGSGKDKFLLKINRVIHIQPFLKKRTFVSGLGRPVNWHVRFTVPGHWMRHPAGSHGVGKSPTGVRDGTILGRTWRNSYIKGPEGAPLVTRTRISEDWIDEKAAEGLT